MKTKKQKREIARQDWLLAFAAVMGAGAGALSMTVQAYVSIADPAYNFALGSILFGGGMIGMIRFADARREADAEASA